MVNTGCRLVHPLQAQFPGPGMQEGHEAGICRICGVCGFANADMVVLVQHHKLAIPGIVKAGQGRGKLCQAGASSRQAGKMGGRQW